ncbi:MAG: carbohydrate ABC transporter permease [Spirochaetes bacterium]|nr:carbohydrate ABC transporter permease [Deltaproteobacteria bacterium]RKY00172.1 MAG: carbohydrate ABC transporter permease [Spirochaetota bacterium]
MGKFYHLKRFINYIIVIIIVFAALFPIYWIFQSSFKPPIEHLTSPPLWFPKHITGENYISLFKNSDIVETLLNSIIITSLSVFIAMLIGTPAAYSIARFNVGGINFPLFILLVRMTPPIVFVIPFFLIAKKLGLQDSYISIILTEVFFIIPLAVWMMIGFFYDLPTSLEEAAMVDGCSRWQAMVKIVLPLTSPGLAATAILCSILVWNDFLFPLILTGSRTRTLPVLVNSFVTQRGLDYGLMCATGVIMTIPMAIFGVAVQKYLVQGLTSGAMKG